MVVDVLGCHGKGHKLKVDWYRVSRFFVSSEEIVVLSTSTIDNTNRLVTFLSSKKVSV